MVRPVFLFFLFIDVLVSSVSCLAVPMDDQKDVTDQDKLEYLGAKILTLQSQMDEIVRSFKTLRLIADNPSLINEITDTKNDGSDVLIRHRRDGDQSPTSGDGSTPTDGAQDPMVPSNGQSFLGPYSYPMFSGQCFLCPAGKEGPRGPPGQQGQPGRDGRDGRDAVNVPAEGQSPPVNVPTQAPVVTQPSSQTQNKEGAVYVRWGKSDCANGSELVYAGTMAGAYYSHVGSGSNYLCMPSEPVYKEYKAGVQGGRGFVYSAEYETHDAPGSLTAAIDHTPTCAVCMAPEGRTSKMMVPARNDCPSADWRLEYAGYLMSTDNDHKRGEYICVDEEMEVEPGSQGSQNGALLYLVESRCLAGGGLPCGPYVDGYELTCAVCTI